MENCSRHDDEFVNWKRFDCCEYMSDLVIENHPAISFCFLPPVT